MGERRGCKDVEKVETRQNRYALPSADGNRRSVLPPKHGGGTVSASSDGRVSTGATLVLPHRLRGSCRLGREASLLALAPTLCVDSSSPLPCTQFPEIPPIFRPNSRALIKPLLNLITPCLSTSSTSNYTTVDWVRLVKSPAIDSLGRYTRNLICDKDLAQREGDSDA